MARTWVGLVSACLIAALAGFARADGPGMDPDGRGLPAPGPELRKTIADLAARAAKHPRDAELRAELGVAWRRTGTVEGRLRSVRRLEEAADLAGCGDSLAAPGSATCARIFFALGLTRAAQGFEAYARTALRKSIARDSTIAGAQLALGLSLFRTWRELALPRDPTFPECRRCLARALELDPKCVPAAVPLVIMDRMVADTAAAREVTTRLLEADPSAAEPHLLEGMLAYQAGAVDTAEAAYAQGLVILAESDPALLGAMADISTLLPHQQALAYLNLDAAGRREQERRYWQSCDPTPTTPVNEKRLEHLERVLVADALFAVPDLKLRGWDTERGRTWIRYGPPNAQHYDMGSVDNENPLVPGRHGAEFAAGLAKFDPPSLIWSYAFEDGSFAIRFDDWGLHGNYSLPRESGPGGWVERTYLFEEATPTLTRWRYPGQELPVLASAYRFLSAAGRPELAFFFELPSKSIPWRAQAAGWALEAQRRLSIFDGQWRKVGEQDESATYRGGATLAEARSTLFVDCLQVEVPPGNYHAALEVEEKSRAARALWRGDVAAESLGAGPLLLSDVVFARRVEEAQGAGPLTRGELKITPRPGHAFRRGEPVTFYYEVYGLQPEATGATRYAVNYRVEALDRTSGGGGSRAGRLLHALFGVGKPQSVSYGFERTGTSSRAAEVLSLDAAELPSGHYRLTVEVRDETGNRAASRVGLFQVNEPR